MPDQKIYDSLNAAQRTAVERIEGPVLVIAGPGTGKTQVLSARIARILEVTDTQPSNILALTFTESAAKNMRDRVVAMIGTAGYSVTITTFHSFCQSVMSEYPEYFPISREAQPLSDIERYDLFEKILSEAKIEVLKPINMPHFYIKDVMSAISDLKREGLSVEAFQQLVATEFADSAEPEDVTKAVLQKWQKQKAKNEELAVLYAAYETALRAAARYDFDDMIALTAAAFAEHETLTQAYQEQLLYILVDEYQDTNSAQANILQRLTSFWGDQANIFVVGDPHQSIYRFQGASTENMLSFLAAYPQAAVITLVDGYRCPQLLSDAAHALIAHNQLTSVAETSDQLQSASTLQLALQQPLKSHREVTETPLELWSAPSQTVELIQIAEQIQKLLAEGVPADQVAVLYRTNRESVELSEVLDKWQIPFELEGGLNLLEVRVVQIFLLLLQTIAALREGTEDGQLFTLLSQPFWGIDTTTLYMFSRCAGHERVPLYQLIMAEDSRERLAGFDCTVSAEFHQTIQEKIAQLQSWGVLDAQVTFPELFEKILTESGFLTWVRAEPQAGEHLQALNTLFDQVKQLVQVRHSLRLSEFLHAIELMQTHGISITVHGLQMTQEAVCLATVHKAKGREWQYVFIIHCLDGSWGNSRNRTMIPLPEGVLQHTDSTKKEKNEDDRRLMYVALTRAKLKTIVSYPESIRANNRVRAVTPSMFITELQSAVPTLQPQQSEQVKAKEAEYLERVLSPAVPVQSHSSETKKFLEAAVADFTLSVTALNTYLRDPQEFLLSTLLRVPQAKAGYLAFGTAVHAALERLYLDILAGKTPDLNRVTAEYERALKREILLPEEFERRLAYGKTVLKQYYSQLDTAVIMPWQTEKVFGTRGSQVYLNDIALTGRIDRFDWIDKRAKLVRVVDYKTGTHKSVGDIEGKTVAATLSEREQTLPESIKGPYKRQLLFYKLLTELDTRFQPTATVGSFEFVEPHKQTGKIAIRQFELLDNDVADLKQLITEVMREIRSLSFLSATSS